MSASNNFDRDDTSQPNKSRKSKRECAVCQSVSNLKRCSRCKAVFYCCITHQKTDWINHKNACGKISVTSSPSKSKFRSCSAVIKDGEDFGINETLIESSNHLSSSSVSQESNSLQRNDAADEVASEIQSILDFRSVQSFPHAESRETHATASEDCKDIFGELKHSNIEECTYMGPSNGITSEENPVQNNSSNRQLVSNENGHNPFHNQPTEFEINAYLNSQDENSEVLQNNDNDSFNQSTAVCLTDIDLLREITTDLNSQEEHFDILQNISERENNNIDVSLNESVNLLDNQDNIEQTTNTMIKLDDEHHTITNTCTSIGDDDTKDSLTSTVTEFPTNLDARPLRKLKFPKPDSYETNELAEFIGLRLINLGYCILDDLFEVNQVNKMYKELNDFSSKHSLFYDRLFDSDLHASGGQLILNVENNIENSKIIEDDEQNLGTIFSALSSLDSIMKVINPNLRKYAKIKGRTKVNIKT